MMFDTSLTELLMYVCVGIVAGWVVGELRQGEGYGLLGNAFVGFLGAFFGAYLVQHFETLNLVKFGFPPMVQTAFSAMLGAAVLLFCLDRLGIKT